jgi:hypothetical protein
MDIQTLRDTFSNARPPSDISDQAKSLWYAGKGDWDRAHQIVQDLPDKFSSQIHAFLHRQEGDLSNATYWYDKADSKMPSLSLEQEWEKLTERAISG